MTPMRSTRLLPFLSLAHISASPFRCDGNREASYQHATFKAFDVPLVGARAVPCFVAERAQGQCLPSPLVIFSAQL
jgi:hypothetical protein